MKTLLLDFDQIDKVDLEALRRRVYDDGCMLLVYTRIVESQAHTAVIPQLEKLGVPYHGLLFGIMPDGMELMP